MDENVKGTGHSDVDELLLPNDSKKQKGKVADVDEEKSSFKIDWFSAPVITVAVVAVLALISIIVIMSNASLHEQFQYILRGELGKYKAEIARLEEEKIRDIENLTGNRYGSVTLFYSPRDSQVAIKQYKYVKDCSRFAGVEDELLDCLDNPFDYAANPEVTTIDNKSLHLDAAKKEVVENLPFTDMPIQEANDERTIVWAYEVQIEITREGYEPRKFHFTGERSRIGALGEGWESKFWDQKGPGLYMVDFQGADLTPLPETAKNNYVAAVKEFECIRREVEAKRAAGKPISDQQVADVFIEILNRHEIKSRDDFFKIENGLRQTQPEWFEGFMKELTALTCTASAATPN